MFSEAETPNGDATSGMASPESDIVQQMDSNTIEDKEGRDDCIIKLPNLVAISTFLW